MKKILVIEDNTEVRENLCEILELANYTTYQAENGKLGVALAKEHIPDLILCDVMMPVLDGFGVLHIINRDAKLRHIPFMFLTAKSEKSDFRKGMGLGADDYITKPFDELELMSAIEMRLKKSEQVQAISNTEQGIRTFFSGNKAEAALKKLIANRELRKLDKKSSIYEISQYPKYLYLVVTGCVKTIQVTPTGKELIHSIYGPGDFLGLISLIQDVPYHESAICSESTEVLLIPVEDFRIAIFNDRDFNLKFFHLLADQASQTETQLVDLAFSSVRKKVANAILTFARKKKSSELTIAREDLAAMAGTARESVIRTLTDFKNEALIRIDEGKIILLDKDDLENLPQ